MLHNFSISAFAIAAVIAGDVFASEFSSCAAVASPIECYVDFVVAHEGDQSAKDALDKLVEIIESDNDEKSRILKMDRVLDKIGKHYLPYIPAYLRFYVSGPNHLELFHLIEMKEKGVSNGDLINIVLNAKGSYGSIGPRGIEILQKHGFSPLLIKLLVNHSFLKQGDKVNIISLRMLVRSDAPEKEKLELVALSNIRELKINDEKHELLLGLGFTDEQVKILKYNQLLRDGPSDYPIWKVIQDRRDKLSEGAIVKKISATDFYYRNFNEVEVELLGSFGVSPAVMKAMQDCSQRFFAEVSKAAKKPDNRNQADNVVYDKTTKYVQAYQQNNDLFRGVATEKTAKEGGGIVDAAKDCLALKVAMKACERVPFPLGYACTSLAKNKFECKVPL